MLGIGEVLEPKDSRETGRPSTWEPEEPEAPEPLGPPIGMGLDESLVAIAELSLLAAEQITGAPAAVSAQSRQSAAAGTDRLAAAMEKVRKLLEEKNAV